MEKQYCPKHNFTGTEYCPGCVPDAARASVMPAHLQPIDPTFYDAVNEFEPDEWALLEKGVKG